MNLRPSLFFGKIGPTWRARLAVTLIVGVVLWLIEGSAPLRSLEWMSEGFRIKWRAWAGNPPPSGQVVLVGIDMEALHTFGRWPFPRPVFGQAIDWLGRDKSTHPAALGWDVLFTEESSSDPAIDKLFAEPIAKNLYPVVLGAELDEAADGLLMRYKGVLTAVPSHMAPPLAEAKGPLALLPDREGGQLPLPELLGGAQFAFLNADADSDGIVRQIPLIARVGPHIYPSLVLQSLMSYLHATSDQVEIIPGKAVLLNPKEKPQIRIPIDAEGNYTLNYRYELRSDKFPDGIPELSFAKLYDSLLRRVELGEEIALPEIAGKIVIVGQTANGLTDIGPSLLTGKSAKVLVHINALENILRNDFLHKTSFWPMLALMLASGLGVAWVLDHRRVLYFIAVGMVVLAAIIVSYVLLVKSNLMVPLAVPLVAFGLQQSAVAFFKIREEQAQRDRIRRMFGSYVSPELVRRMVDARAEPQLGGHEDEITAFFSDIQGFSAFSEVLSAADLVVLLNEYLGGMTDILQDNGGALDKYIGDAIVAMFGGLVPLKDHARRACEVAAKMQMRQAELRKHWQSQGDRWPGLVHNMRTRIGLNSGQVVVGNMGSRHRFNYTMMGDTVNLAARCESGAKTFGVYTAATGATVSAARMAGCECVFRPLDRIVVKGRKEPAEIFEIVALSPGHLPEGAARCLELFAKGRAHYLQQNWDEALRCFEEAAPLEPLQPERDAGVESNPSLLMQARCLALKAKPPGADWDGVYRMTTK